MATKTYNLNATTTTATTLTSLANNPTNIIANDNDNRQRLNRMTTATTTRPTAMQLMQCHIMYPLQASKCVGNVNIAPHCPLPPFQ